MKVELATQIWANSSIWGTLCVKARRTRRRERTGVINTLPLLPLGLSASGQTRSSRYGHAGRDSMFCRRLCLHYFRVIYHLYPKCPYPLAQRDFRWWLEVSERFTTCGKVQMMFRLLWTSIVAYPIFTPEVHPAIQTTYSWFRMLGMTTPILISHRFSRLLTTLISSSIPNWRSALDLSDMKFKLYFLPRLLLRCFHIACVSLPTSNNF